MYITSACVILKKVLDNTNNKIYFPIQKSLVHQLLLSPIPFMLKRN